jgi:O-antigen/teichoic acid export membrane protein
MTGSLVVAVAALLAAAGLFVALARVDARYRTTPRQPSPLDVVSTFVALLAVSAYVIVRALLGLEVTP